MTIRKSPNKSHYVWPANQQPGYDNKIYVCNASEINQYSLPILGLVQTSCSVCGAELNLRIKFDKSTAEARRLNHSFELSLPCYTTLVLQ